MGLRQSGDVRYLNGRKMAEYAVSRFFQVGDGDLGDIGSFTLTFETRRDMTCFLFSDQYRSVLVDRRRCLVGDVRRELLTKVRKIYPTKKAERDDVAREAVRIIEARRRLD